MNDLATFPGTVSVAFPATGSGSPVTGFFVIDVTLVSLALPEFNTITGSPWAKLLHRYETAVYAGGASPANLVALTTLANRIATDWYYWQLAALGEYFVGVTDWTPEGSHDVEWTQESDKITTLVQRDVFNPNEDLMLSPFAAGPFARKCVTLCDGSQECWTVPQAWITPGPCASGSGSTVDTVSVTCDGVTYQIPKQLCMLTENIDPTGNPPGTAAGCPMSADPLQLTFVSETTDSGGTTWVWAGVNTVGACRKVANLTIFSPIEGGPCTITLRGFFPILDGSVDDIGDAFGRPPLIGPLPAWVANPLGVLQNVVVTFGGVVYICLQNIPPPGDVAPPTFPWLATTLTGNFSFDPLYMEFAAAQDYFSPGQTGKYTILPGECALPAIIYFSSTDICTTTTSLTIHGANFLPSDSVTFTPAGSGSTTYISSNTLSVTSITGLTAGALFASVRGLSPVQVATVIPAPTIDVNTADVTQATGTFSFTGTGFIPGGTTATMDSGTWTTTSVTPTMITGNFSVAPDTGVLNATVVTMCGTAGPTQVANIVGGGGSITFDALGGSTTTDVSPALTYSVTLSEAGMLVVNAYVPITVGTVTISATYTGTGGGSLSGVSSPGSNGMILFQLSMAVASAGTGDIQLTTTGTATGLLSNAYLIKGLPSNLLDVSANNEGNTPVDPITGFTGSPSADNGAIAGFGFKADSVGSAFIAGFTSDSGIWQSVSFGLGQDYFLISGHTVETVGGGPWQASAVNVTSFGFWQAIGGGYK